MAAPSTQVSPDSFSVRLRTVFHLSEYPTDFPSRQRFSLTARTTLVGSAKEGLTIGLFVKFRLGVIRVETLHFVSYGKDNVHVSVMRSLTFLYLDRLQSRTHALFLCLAYLSRPPSSFPLCGSLDFLSVGCAFAPVSYMGVGETCIVCGSLLLTPVY